MIFKNTVLLFLTLAFLSGFPGNLINFTGRKYTLRDGRICLLFTCSSSTTPFNSYAEFLVNGITTAGSTYIAATNKCIFKSSEKNCSNMCTCSSDGQIFTWTFPLLSKRKVRFSCQMFLKNQYNAEQADIMFNGTDFTFNMPHNDALTSTIKTTITNVKIDNNYDVRKDEASKALFVIVAVIVSLVVTAGICMICFLWFRYKKRTSKCDGDQEIEKALIKQDQNTDDVQEEKKEEQNLVKLNRLITKIGMKVMRAYFRKQVLQENNLFSFLETNKHKMFHAMHPQKRCCQCLTKRLDINRLRILKQHFDGLYSRQNEPCEFSSQTKCICTYTPHKTVVLDTLDLSTLTSIVSVVPTGTATLQNLIQVQTFSKEIIQFLGTGSVPNNEFKTIWEKIKNFFLGLAQDIDFSTEDLQATGKEIQSLFAANIEKTNDEYAEILMQLKNYDELFNLEHAPSIKAKRGLQNVIKLNRLLSIGMMVSRTFFMKRVLQENDLQSFLEKNKHILFHAVHPTRQCCNCLNNKIECDYVRVLMVRQFNDLYTVSKDIQSCQLSNKMTCICGFIPNHTVSEDTFDLSKIIGISTVLPIDATIQRDLIQIRTFCNEIACFQGTGMVSDDQFENIWERVKNLLLGLASAVGFGAQERTRQEIQTLHSDITEMTSNEFTEVLSQWQKFHELSIQQQDEIQFQKEAEKFEPLSSDKMILYMVDQLEVFISEFDDRKMDTLKDKPVQKALIRVCVPPTWDIDAIATPMTVMKKKVSIKIIEKSDDGKAILFVTLIHIQQELFEDKTLFGKALLELVKEIVKMNEIDSSTSDTIQITFTFSKVKPKELSKPTLSGVEPVRMYLQRGGQRFINSSAFLSDNEVVFIEQFNKVLVIYNYKTQVRHIQNLLACPFDLAVLPNNRIAVSFSDLTEIHLYSNKLSLIESVKMNEKCFSIGKRDEFSIYVYTEDKGLCVLSLAEKRSLVFEITLLDYDPFKDAISFGDKYIYYTSCMRNSVYCYDIRAQYLRIIDGTFNNPSSIATMQDYVFVSVSDDSGEVYVKRVEGSSHQVVFSKKDGLEISNMIHVYEKRSWLMFVNKDTGFASYRKLQWLGAQVAVSSSKT